VLAVEALLYALLHYLCPTLSQLSRQMGGMRITSKLIAAAIYHSGITKYLSITFVVTMNVTTYADL
jgi:hypothetical protein